jgi:hypothetical protein
MTVSTAPYPGPLFYPTIGAVAVMKSGARIQVWGDEGSRPDCFTGIELATGDASVMWGREFIAYMEEAA